MLRHKPLALVETVAQKRLVRHLSQDVPPMVQPGMSLTEARAHCAALIDLPTTPDEDTRALEALGRWLVRFSPSVAVEPPATVFLDATGLERLFGGVDRLRGRIVDALSRLGISASVAIAPTPGAAYAIAAFGGAHAPSIIEHPGDIDTALSALPPEALRLDPPTSASLRSLGIASIAALRRLPRAALTARFGPHLLRRIDQAFGTLQEPLVFLRHHVPVRASVEFESAVDSLDALHLALDELVTRVVAELTRQGLGARCLRVVLDQPYGPPVERRVELTRPSRDRSNLLNLLRCTLETLKLDEGFLRVTLAAPTTQRLPHAQEVLAGGEEDRQAAEADGLVERLRARMERSVHRMALVASHAPERAFTHRSDGGKDLPACPGSAHPASPARPLRLFNTPREIRVIVTPSEHRDGWPVSFTDAAGDVHRLAYVRGPERIAGEWWNGRWKTRDYFDAIDAEGHRYWLFRVAESGRWFLHGVFA